MEEEAVNDFIFLSELSYECGLIDRFVYLERIATLYYLTDVDPKIISILPEYAQQYYM